MWFTSRSQTRKNDDFIEESLIVETPLMPGQSQVSGNVMFYSKPEPLSVAAHGHLGVKQIDRPFQFLRTEHAVPLTTNEFGMAASSYPIIFVGENRAPIAVMGIRQGQNLYVSAEGIPSEDHYIPAFVRRYPFVFANDDSREQLLLCVDRDAPMVSDTPDVAFFDGQEPSEFTKNAIEFCKEFERQRRGTDLFLNIMKEHDLFEEKTVNFQPRDANGQESGAPQKIADYWAISEERLNNLSAENFQKIRETGALSVIYAHFISLLLWPQVISRAIKIPQQAGTA